MWLLKDIVTVELVVKISYKPMVVGMKTQSGQAAPVSNVMTAMELGVSEITELNEMLPVWS